MVGKNSRSLVSAVLQSVGCRAAESLGQISLHIHTDDNKRGNTFIEDTVVYCLHQPNDLLHLISLQNVNFVFAKSFFWCSTVVLCLLGNEAPI